AAGRDVLVVTSTFGDGEAPDNGAGFWARLDAPDAPALDGIRYAVLGIGDRSYSNFCGHAKSIDTRFAALGATPMLERAECEAHDDELIRRWTDSAASLLGGSPAPSIVVAEPFTRAHPIVVPMVRNTLLTAPTSRKEVRQFGFDIS
ncbi:flavodoxin domain-containing protein, partial [Mycolicibacterium elephantis]